MFAIVGLGNPGPEYEATRHNVGFRVADLLAERFSNPSSQSFFKRLTQGFTDWKTQGRCLVRRFNPGDTPLLLIKPQNFMNRSGSAIQPVLHFYRIPLSDVAVIYDDLDLEPGVVRVRRGGGAGGHNGVSDIIQHCGADFVRIRVGIGHPRNRQEGSTDVSAYVLGNPRAEELTQFEESIARAAEVAESWIIGGIQAAQKLATK